MLNGGHFFSRFLFFVFLLSIVFPSFSEDLFKETGNLNEKESRVILNKIANKMELEKIPGTILDFYKKNENEVFFRTDNGLFYSNVSDSNVLIEQLFWRNLGQIEVERSFSDNENRVIVFRNQDMKKGIITDWFTILKISPKKPFEEGDFYQMNGFCRDDEESGENGIDSGEEVKRILVKNIDRDSCPEILISVKVSNYKTKTSEMKMFIFKTIENKYEVWKEVKLISK